VDGWRPYLAGMAHGVRRYARSGSQLHALADRCSHMSGRLSDSDLVDGCLTCPWHGGVFRVSDGSVARGPATAPQPAVDTRVVDGAIQVRLPGAG
jgi:nitrite reductase/ring-hydroxylating ferredoxin subunit